jgi:hypoxanthine phosphoribosyltransferase
VDVRNQLNSICVSELPLKSPGKRYVNPPLEAGKTVLLVDDICTQGHSLEAGRAYIEQTGAAVISMSWLKTINTPFQQLRPLPKFNPYKPNQFKTYDVANLHSYKSQIVDDDAAADIGRQLSRYDDWQWPA